MTGPILLATLGTLVATPLVLAALRRTGTYDVPGARSLHVVPTPRGGGLAPVGALLLAFGTWRGLVGRELWTLLAVVAGLALLGLADDLFALRPGPRLAGQVVAGAGAAVGLGIASDDGIVLGITAAVWVVAFVNAFNFMDGVNGLASGQAVVAGLTWWLLGRHFGVVEVEVPGAVLAAVSAAFTPFNFPRAKVFLGDVGSYGLGGAAALIAVVGVDAGIPVLAMVAPLSLFLADTGSTLIRRRRRQARLFEAHRDHTFQQLYAEGWSHTWITSGSVLLMAGSAACGAVGGWAGATGVAAITVGYLALPCWLKRRQLGWRSG